MQNVFTTFVYFLVESDTAKHRFKIGVSMHPLHRAGALPQKIDMSRSFEIGYHDSGRAYAAERFLHQLCADWRINPSDIGRCNGKTEWFKLEVFEEVLEVIQEFHSDIPLRPIEKRPKRRSAFSLSIASFNAKSATIGKKVTP